ncbi:C-GCAxxG-C-C family (seleno)protein [Megamonas funiformis]|uniref:C-GCAxxG-C-C family (seleno)protein n=1 Tax=Megamonas funiformis TaxID=437897 RepID=UPI00352153B5
MELLQACFFVISLANSAGDKHLPLKSKFDTYNKFQEVAKLFKEKCGSIYCRDLKNMQKNKILSCEDCVQAADKILKKHYFK